MRRPAEWRIDDCSKIKKMLIPDFVLILELRKGKVNLEFLRDVRDLALNLET